MSFGLIEMFQHMGVPALAVAAILSVMGLLSVTVFVERVLAFRRSRRASMQFAAASSAAMKTGDIPAILQATEKHADGHLAQVVKSGLEMYEHARNTADISGLSVTERTRRHLTRTMEEVHQDLRQGLPVLAAVGSVAPFVGLLGTVLGIISAFQGIAATGSGGLSAVSVGISEALLETALGLAVAIPAVLAYHYLSNTIKRDEGRLNRAVGELFDLIEDWAERAAREAQRGRVA
jgi:biopolymer transport protein ExbB